MISVVETPIHSSSNDNSSKSAINCGIFDGGSLYCFGKGEHGRLGLPNYTNMQCKQPTILPKFNTENCVEISSFSSHNLCIDNEGHVYSWGKGEHGRLGNGQNKSCDIPQLLEPLRSYKVKHVAVGLSHSLILTDDGNVWSFGCGEHGRLGHGDSAEFRSPKLIEGLIKTNIHINHISCGAYHSCAITSNGKLWTWGKNDQGQCGLGSVANKDVMIPTLVNLDIDDDKYLASYCDSGWEHTLLITTDGKILSWGIGYEGHRPVLGHGTEKAEYAPKVIEALRNIKIVDVSCGWDHSMCVSEDGKLYTWGDATHGKLGHGMGSHQNVPKQVDFFNDKNIKIISCKGGSNHSAVITSLGELYMFGNGTDFQLGQGSGGSSAQKSTPTKVKLFNGISIAKVTLGDKYTIAITGKPVPTANVYNPLNGMLGRRASMIGLERRRSSLFSGTDLTSLINEAQEELMITFDDRLSRDEYRIHDDEKKEQDGDTTKPVKKEEETTNKDKTTDNDKEKEKSDKQEEDTQDASGNKNEEEEEEEEESEYETDSQDEEEEEYEDEDEEEEKTFKP